MQHYKKKFFDQNLVESTDAEPMDIRTNYTLKAKKDHAE